MSNQPAMTVSGGATVNLEECSFIDTYTAIGNFTEPDFDIEEAPIAQPQESIIRLHQCDFRENDYDIILDTFDTYQMSAVHPNGEALVVSDPYDAGLKVTYSHVEGDYDWPVKRENSTGHASTVPADRRGIDSTSAWFQWVQKVRFHLLLFRPHPVRHP
jgi:hypothetical protein